MAIALSKSPAAGGLGSRSIGETAGSISGVPHRKHANQFQRIGRLVRWLTICFCAILIVSMAAWAGYRTWPRHLSFSLPATLPVPVFRGGRLILQARCDVLMGEVGTFKDELQAYLRFEYLKSLKSVDDDQVLLTATEGGSGPSYHIHIVVPDDLLTAGLFFTELEAKRFITSFDFDFASSHQLAYERRQTGVFEAAYSGPVRRKLEKLSPSELVRPLTRFMIFKSKTDRRVREDIEPAPVPLSNRTARELAADIITVARFYSLPLDFFLGIGAMENNYMNVNGDLRHVIWKRRAEKGDIVLKRRHGHVLVSDYSLGRWQVTLETLRYGHELYLWDRNKRDYSALPSRLRPSMDLEADLARPEVLTTYAGLLFRELLNRFGGNVTKAVGAYNGGPSDPNLQYAAGVQTAAEYARTILEHACALNEETLSRTKLVFRRRRAEADHQGEGATHG